MDFEFINNIRLSLESSNLFMYTIKGAKMCAVLLLFFSIIERWGKNVLNQGNALNDLLTIVGYVFLIISSDFIFDTVESTFSSINIQMNTTSDTMYSDLLMKINEDYEMLFLGATSWYEMLGTALMNASFVVGYLLILILMGLFKIADMSMVCGYLLTRVFFLEIMKLLFPIAVALSTLRQTSGLMAKWFKLYIGVSLLGIIYIGIIKMCALTEEQLHNSFTAYSQNSSFFETYLNINFSVWGALITIIVVFSLKVALFNKSTSYIISFFN